MTTPRSCRADLSELRRCIHHALGKGLSHLECGARCDRVTPVQSTPGVQQRVKGPTPSGRSLRLNRTVPALTLLSSRPRTPGRSLSVAVPADHVHAERGTLIVAERSDWTHPTNPADAGRAFRRSSRCIGRVKWQLCATIVPDGPQNLALKAWRHGTSARRRLLNRPRRSARPPSVCFKFLRRVFRR